MKPSLFGLSLRLGAAIALAGLFFSSGCNDSAFVAQAPATLGQGGQSTGGVAVDTFNVSATAGSKVDLLFCVDNSGSMADDQNVLADTFSAFIDRFVAESVDFRIGIISTDISSTSSSYWQSKLPGYVDPNLGRFLTRYATDKYLTNGTADLVNKFKSNVRVGTTGSGQEQCLGSILAAIDANMLAAGGANSGFYRPDSVQSFVIISDEDETITNGESAEARIQRLKNRVVALRGPASRGFRFDFVINKSAPRPAVLPGPADGTRPYPDVYYKAATAFGAPTYDITTNFSDALLRISEGIVNQSQNEFRLSSLPQNPAAISVKIGSQVLAYNGGNGFIYHADRNTIELLGTAIDRVLGQTLTIVYDIR